MPWTNSILNVSRLKERKKTLTGNTKQTPPHPSKKEEKKNTIDSELTHNYYVNRHKKARSIVPGRDFVEVEWGRGRERGYRGGSREEEWIW